MTTRPTPNSPREVAETPAETPASLRAQADPLSMAAAHGWPSLRGRWLKWDDSPAWQRVYPGREPTGVVVTREDYPLMIETEEALIQVAPYCCFPATTLERKKGVAFTDAAELRARAEEMEREQNSERHCAECVGPSAGGICLECGMVCDQNSDLYGEIPVASPAPVAKGWTRGPVELPASAPGHWSTEAGRDMAQRYVGQPRERLACGDHSDFELANGVFLAGRDSFDLITYQTAAKDRIRWLSANLCATAKERDALAAEVAELRSKLALLDKQPLT